MSKTIKVLESKTANPDKIAEKRAKFPTAAEVNAEIDSEYGWVGKNITDINKAILRELVIARLERRMNNG